MKLKENQAFKVLEKVISWDNPESDATQKEKWDFVMQELINLELGDN